MTDPGGVPRRLDSDTAHELEREFMERVDARLAETDACADPFTGKRLEGTFRRDADFPSDFRDHLRRLESASGQYEPVRWSRLPRGARALYELRGGAIFLRRTRLVVAVAAVHPFEDLAAGRPASPLDPGGAGRWLPVQVRAEAPSIGVVFSSCGWRKSAARPEWNDVAVHLGAPAPGGGFRFVGEDPEAVPEFLRLESREELVTRVRKYIALARVELLMHGLEVVRTAASTGVAVEVAKAAFESAAAEDEFLWLAAEDGTLILRRA